MILPVAFPKGIGYTMECILGPPMVCPAGNRHPMNAPWAFVVSIIGARIPWSLNDSLVDGASRGMHLTMLLPWCHSLFHGVSHGVSHGASHWANAPMCIPFHTCSVGWYIPWCIPWHSPVCYLWSIPWSFFRNVPSGILWDMTHFFFLFFLSSGGWGKIKL